MDIKSLQEKCQRNGFELVYVQTKEEALEKAKNYIKPGVSVGLGGSVTVDEVGVMDFLVSKKDITLFNQYEDGISKEENIHRRKRGMVSDIFITGTNALTLEGELVNCDGDGNRVAGQIYGSDKLLIITGVNKIVKDINEGFDRIKNIAAVKNVERLNRKALTFGKEPYHTIDGISKKYTIITADVPGRTTIILVNETLGY
ncbi:MAG: lactate utilization protein [Flavobacteriaceae bacterium]|jgi:L-lactate utilization protein LutB|nr:lactate utilization protein [Flavobacteriaceae bacterium]